MLCARSCRRRRPAKSEVQVAGVVDLACVLVPAVHENGVAGLGVGGRSCGAAGILSRKHGTCSSGYCPCPRPSRRRDGRVVVGDEDGAVAVAQWHTSHVPEDKHETPLLVVHVPGDTDHLLALTAGVGVEPVRHEQEPSLASNRDQVENEPRQAHLEEHLKVKPAEHARVQLSAHEEIVDVVASHTVLLATPERGNVSNDGNKEARDDRNAHQGSELVNEGVELEESREVEYGGDGIGEVERVDGVVVVAELFATLMRERLAHRIDAGQAFRCGNDPLYARLKRCLPNSDQVMFGSEGNFPS
ncbi:Delta(24(24(1)))-sterol reductase like protein [Hortaea werneckii]|nr:Delta(24(24(1)))-sterol reductase like protein [Hortaea werneckii]